MKILTELISRSNNSNSRILQIEYLKNSQKIILLRVKENLELFIEILDIENNLLKEIILNEKMYITSAVFENYYFWFDKENFNFHEIDTLYSVRHFHALDEENFFLNVLKNDQNFISLKVKSSGKISYLASFENSKYGKYNSMNDKHIMKNYIYREDMTLFDFKDCKEKRIFDFISENFDELDDYPFFTYLYFTEARYTIFTFPNKNIIGFEIYDKDGDEPKFSYYILKINHLENIEIIFKGKSYDSGHYYILSEDASEFAYKKQNYDEVTNIFIRELSENFPDAEIHKEITDEKIVYLNNRKVFLQKENELQVLDRRTEHLYSIHLDIGTPYEIKDNYIFYIKNGKLVFENI